jgi:hypothetical protein
MEIEWSQDLSHPVDMETSQPTTNVRKRNRNTEDARISIYDYAKRMKRHDTSTFRERISPSRQSELRHLAERIVGYFDIVKQGNIDYEGSRWLTPDDYAQRILQYNIDDSIHAGDRSIRLTLYGFARLLYYNVSYIWHLELRDWDLSVEEFVLLMRCLEDSRVVRSLEVVASDGIYMHFLYIMLRSNTSIELLTLSYINFTHVRMADLLDSLASNTHVSALAFKMCNLEEVRTADFFTYLQSNTKISRLIFDYIHGNDDFASHLCQYIQHSSHLRQLHVHCSEGTFFTENKAVILYRSLLEVDRIEHLYLREVWLSDESVEYLLQFLQNQRNIRTLVLFDCLIGVEYVRRICQCASINEQIVCLDLSNNDIQDRGAFYLSLFLLANTTLQELILNFDSITDQGIAYICESLKYNSTLTKICVSGSIITNSGLRDFSNIFESNFVLQRAAVRRGMREEDQESVRIDDVIIDMQKRNKYLISLFDPGTK